MRFTDRSRTELDWKCPRARYWSTEHGGIGLSPVADAPELVFGKALHEAFDRFARHVGPGTPIEALALPLRAELLRDLAPLFPDFTRAQELAVIGEGLLRAFALVTWPQLMRDYEVVSPEVEVTYPLSPSVTFMARPDLILRRRDDHTFWYIEYKTTSSNEDRWINAWLKAVQLHSGVFAARATLRLPIEGAIVVGLYKGYADRRREGQRRSPFAYCWRTDDVPGVLAPKIAYEARRQKGWFLAPTWDLPIPFATYVREMPEGLLREQLPQTPPIFLREDMVETFFAQRAMREERLAEWHAAGAPASALDSLFPQQFSQCSPGWGYSCAFADACWLPHIGAAPLESGSFVQRVPHHAPERDHHE